MPRARARTASRGCSPKAPPNGTLAVQPARRNSDCGPPRVAVRSSLAARRVVKTLSTTSQRLTPVAALDSCLTAFPPQSRRRPSTTPHSLSHSLLPPDSVWNLKRGCSSRANRTLSPPRPSHWPLPPLRATLAGRDDGPPHGFRKRSRGCCAAAAEAQGRGQRGGPGAASSDVMGRHTRGWGGVILEGAALCQAHGALQP